MSPRSGDCLRITRRASVQFRVPFLFRVVRVLDWETPDGWAWLDGYQLDSSGDAVERRSIFVQLRGLVSAGMADPLARRTAQPGDAPAARPARRAPRSRPKPATVGEDQGGAAQAS